MPPIRASVVDRTATTAGQLRSTRCWRTQRSSRP